MVMTMIIPLAMPKPKAANDDVDDVDIDESPVNLQFINTASLSGEHEYNAGNGPSSLRQKDLDVSKQTDVANDVAVEIANGGAIPPDENM